MSHEFCKTIRLMFWVNRDLVSKFVCPLIPNIGEVWEVNRGTHKYEGEEGRIALKIIHKVVSPDFGDQAKPTDINLNCEEIPPGHGPLP